MPVISFSPVLMSVRRGTISGYFDPRRITLMTMFLMFHRFYVGDNRTTKENVNHRWLRLCRNSCSFGMTTRECCPTNSSRKGRVTKHIRNAACDEFSDRLLSQCRNSLDWVFFTTGNTDAVFRGPHEYESHFLYYAILSRIMYSNYPSHIRQLKPIIGL